MKKIFIISFIIMVASVSFAQAQPVKWQFEAVKKSNNQFEIIATAYIDAPWHMYSQFVKGGPVPTSFRFKANPLVRLSDKMQEEGRVEKNFDKNFGVEIATFSNKVQFKQLATLKVNAKTKIAGVVEFMVCDDSHCLPPSKQAFELVLQ